MRTIIVTGFEAFGGSETNASWEAVRRMADVDAILLPVSFSRACAMIREIVSGRPEAVLCVGEAGNRDVISVERVAINLMDARIPDNDGCRPMDEPVCPGRPAAWFSTLPVREIRAAMRNAELSLTAGTYVCNAVFYTLMDEISRNGADTAGGFIHVPAQRTAYESITAELQKAVGCIRGHRAGRRFLAGNGRIW